MATTVVATLWACLSQCVVSRENEVSNRSFNINALGILCYGRVSGSIVSVLFFKYSRNIDI